MNIIKPFVIALLLSSLAVAQESVPEAQDALPAENPEEIVVTGILPGPPLWKVMKDDHTLWIFGYLTPIPNHMQWQSDRVEKVLANAQEYIPMPKTEIDISPWVKYNPINLVRGWRLANRLQHSVDNKPLAEVLPPELYERFVALKTKYFPRNNDIEKLRPLSAGSAMVREITQKEDLKQANAILSRIDRLAARNRKLKTTDVEVAVKLEGGYGTLAERVETMVNSITPAQEFACFDTQLARMETDLEAMKSRANSWAQGYIGEFRGIRLLRGEDDPCFNLLLASSEGATITDLFNRQKQEWLKAAESALERNTSTFAVLQIRELIEKNGLLAQLAARGYDIKAP